MLDPTLIAIFFSGVVTVLLGFVWYNPHVFGGVWMRLAGITPEMQEAGKRSMPLMVFFAFLAAMLVAYVMSYVSAAWGFYEWRGALQLGAWLWIGFVAPTMIGIVLWEGRSFTLYLINSLFWLVAFLLMAQIIVFAYSIEYAMYQQLTADTSGYEAME